MHMLDQRREVLEFDTTVKDFLTGGNSMLVGNGASGVGDFLKRCTQVPSWIEVNSRAIIVDLADTRPLGVVHKAVGDAALADERGEVVGGPGKGSARAAELVAIGIVAVAGILDAGG